MIILEGPDGSGKTTVAERLGYERRHFKALRGGTGEGDRGAWGGSDPAPIAYARQVLAALEEERDSVYHPNGIGAPPRPRYVAFDRFHLSETVYGPILRGGSGIADEEVTILRRLLRARGVPTILCLPPWEETRRNVTREGRERPAYQTPTFLAGAYRAWREVRPDWIDRTFDYTRDHVEGLRLLPRRVCPYGVVGSPTARFLLVGERSNLPLDLPFFSMAGSSALLNRSLWYAGYEEAEIALTNAFTSEGRPRDLRACLLASTTHVVALGVEAHAELVRQELPLATLFNVPHPQYWRRFHAREESRYSDLLREIREMSW